MLPDFVREALRDRVIQAGLAMAAVGVILIVVAAVVILT